MDISFPSGFFCQADFRQEFPTGVSNRSFQQDILTGFSDIPSISPNEVIF
jgi:hypothetical protein